MARTKPTDETRTKRIEARIAPAALDMVKRAAALRGNSVSDFVVDAAREKAERDLEENRVIRLAAAEQERFVAMLLAPPKPNAVLERAAAAHARLIKS
jgi:uncharacterized protein (DUF1778 family)